VYVNPLKDEIFKNFFKEKLKRTCFLYIINTSNIKFFFLKKSEYMHINKLGVFMLFKEFLNYYILIAQNNGFHYNIFMCRHVFYSFPLLFI
jgi:hypothetical protein